MPKHHKLELSENERQKLVELRDKLNRLIYGNGLLPC